MASIHRKPNSPFWHAAFYLPDGRRTQRSTGTANRKKALAIALEYDKAARTGRQGLLTDQKAREAIASIYAIANADLLPTSTVGEYLDRWLKVKTIETKDSTVAEYSKTAERLKKILGPKVNRPMDAVTVNDALRFRDGLADILAPATDNKVKILDTQGSTRRGFTLDQVKAIYNLASPSWRGMILLGFYCGQRLADLARLTWQNVDLEEEVIRLTTGKTGRPMVIPMARPLVDFLSNLPASDNPMDPIFPDLADLRTQTLSGQFSAIVADAGFGTYDKYHRGQKDGPGRAARRATGNLTFHSLRHTATSQLKNAGVSDVVAREIIGHDSEAISRHYTKIETTTLRNAVNRLPNIAVQGKPK